MYSGLLHVDGDANSFFERPNSEVWKHMKLEQTIQYHKNIEQAEQEQLIGGKKFLAAKKGRIDNRSEARTPAQTAATEKLVAKEQREAAKKHLLR